MNENVKVTGVALLSAFFVSACFSHEIAYEDLRGARRKNPETGNWEVGWAAPGYKTANTWIYPIEGLEGVAYKEINRAGEGNQTVTLKDLGVDPAKGVELPLLGVKPDFYVITARDRECPVRYYADDGTVAQEWWTGSEAFYPWWNNSVPTEKKVEFLNSDGSPEKRAAIINSFADTMCVRSVPLDSRWLDTNTDGRWQPERVLMTRNCRLPITLKHVMFLPATSVDVPVRRKWRKGARIEFRYVNEEGTHEASFLLDPEFMPGKGNLRLGFVGSGGAVYIAQTPGRGKEGIVIGKTTASRRRLTIVPGSLCVEQAKWVPYDRVPVNKRKWIGGEGCPGTDTAAFDARPIRDWGYLSDHPKSIHGGRKAYPRRNPCTRLRYDLFVRGRKDLCRIARKYGIHSSLDIGSSGYSPRYVPEKYHAEVLDRETGEFVKAGYLDWANPELAAWMKERVGRDLAGYAGEDAPDFLQVHEGWGQRWLGNMSEHALKNFREFAGDPKALFPVPSSWPETERTTNKPEEIMKWFPAYQEWKHFYRGLIMARHMRAGYEILKGSPHFKGIGYFGGDMGGISYLAEAPETALVCEENVGMSILPSKDKAFEGIRRPARKYADRLTLLVHSHQFFVNTSTERFIEWFVDLASLPEVDGILLGGGGKTPVSLFKAMAARHFGKGRMSEEEADRIIETCKEKGIWHFEGGDKKKGEQLKSKGVFHLNLETAGRAAAERGKRKIDSDLGDWQGAKWYTAEKEENLLNGKKEDWSGKKDLSFSFAAAWDDENLYLAVRVMDDNVVPRKYTKSTEGDEVELRMEFLSDPAKEPLTIPGKKYFRLSPESEKREVYRGHGTDQALENGLAAAKSTENGYVIEAAIPWKEFGYEARAGNVLPIEWHVLDADQLLGGIDHSMIWNVVEDKKVPWYPPGMRQWGVMELCNGER